MNMNYTREEDRDSSRIDAGLLDHMNKVYRTMSTGLMVTFATAWVICNTPSLMAIFYNPEDLSPTLIGWIAIFSPILMIFGFNGAAAKGTASSVRNFFYVFSAVLGISMSSLFAAYTTASIAQVFLLTSISFAVLSLWGYTTGKDLSGWGSFLLMGLVGLIGAMVLNIFIGSSGLNFAIGVIGVGIFAALTAYDTQTIKASYLENKGIVEDDKMAILGAMSLYLNFINLFQMFMSLFGDD